MDPFVTYLLVINVVTFALFIIDCLIALRNEDVDTGLMDGGILSLFGVAGGCLGMLLALAIGTRLWSRHFITKANVAWWFIAFASLVVWVLVCAARWGLLALDPDPGRLLSGWNLGFLKVLGVYLLAMNVITFSLFVVDKRRAESGDFRNRIPEGTLIGLSFLGGSLGGILAMRLVRHKTKRWYFTVGLPFFVVLHVFVLVFLHQAGVI